MNLRSATQEDGPKVRDLIFSVLEEYGLKPDPNGTDRDLADIDSYYLKRGGCFEVLEDGSRQIVGSFGLSPLGKGGCELRKMYLAPSARGQGLGKRLLERALHRARELKFTEVELETASVLKEAIQLYKRYGFVPKTNDHLASRCDQAYVLSLK